MTKALIVDAREKDSFDFGGLSVRWKVDGNQTGGRFSVVHHPTAPHALGAPLHYHHNDVGLQAPAAVAHVISPAGFENYFREVAEAWGDMSKFTHINQKYALEMRFERVPDPCQRFGLTFPAL